MKVSKEPLYDLEDNLLGYSCVATFSFNEVIPALTYRSSKQLREQAGINADSRGVTWDKNLQKREYYFEWFQPVIYDITTYTGTI